MRILPFMPPQEGYESPSAELNQDEGVLDISHPSPCVLVEDSKRVAETVMLRCALRPIPLEKRTANIRLTLEGQKLQAIPLYDEKSVTYGYERSIKDSQYQGIGLEYAGVGEAIIQGRAIPIQGMSLPTGTIKGDPLLYVKPFRWESENVQARMTTFPSGERLTSPPGALDAQILRGYGGYYKEGIDLEEIQQIFYTLTSTQSHTRVRLISSSTLKAQSTPPPQGGKKGPLTVNFNPCPRKEEYLSLPGAVAAGYARLMVASEGEKVVLTSFLCEEVPGHPTFVNVYFQP